MPENESLTPKPTRYSPRETDSIRKAAVQDVLLAQTDLLIKAEHRTDLGDIDAVRTVTGEYMRICADTGICPNLEGLAARLGISRARVYRFIKDHPDSETARFLDQARLMWASARMSLCERGFLDPAMSIFILKNSELNFADRHELTVDADPDRNNGRPAWAQGMSDEQYIGELMQGIPEEE